MNPASSAPVVVGQILADKYRVERMLGVGGMGAVVAARHVELDELRAIKVMLPQVHSNPVAVERFLREARAAVKLKSAHVVKIFDVGRLESGEPYIVMEHLEGEDLREALLRGRLPSCSQSVDLMMQALEALAEAHAAGMVHRDMKPANLFLSRDADGLPSLKVLDFGISKLAVEYGTGQMDMTKTSSLLGSPYYMSPEQMRSTRDVDARADIWSMGVIMYELIGGALPFLGESITQLCLAVVQDDPTPPRLRNAEIHPGLERVIMRCLEKERQARYGSVAELAADLWSYGSARARVSFDRITRVTQEAAERASRPSSAGVVSTVLMGDEPPEAALETGPTVSPATEAGRFPAPPRAALQPAMLSAQPVVAQPTVGYLPTEGSDLATTLPHHESYVPTEPPPALPPKAPPPAQPYVGQPSHPEAQPYAAPPSTVAAQPYAAQPYAAQPYAAQPYGAQPSWVTAQPYAAAPPAPAPELGFSQSRPGIPMDTLSRTPWPATAAGRTGRSVWILSAVATVLVVGGILAAVVFLQPSQHNAHSDESDGALAATTASAGNRADREQPSPATTDGASATAAAASGASPADTGPVAATNPGGPGVGKGTAAAPGAGSSASPASATAHTSSAPAAASAPAAPTSVPVAPPTAREPTPPASGTAWSHRRTID